MTFFDRCSGSYRRELARVLRPLGATPEEFARCKAELLERTAERRLGPPRRLRVLDVGCGTGLVEEHLAGRFGEVVGVDTSRKMVEECRGMGVPARFLAVEEGSPLPFEEDAFDLAFCACVLHHLPAGERPALLQEMARVVRPGGLVAVFEHNPLHPVTRWIVSRCELDREVEELVGPGEVLRAMEAVGLVRPALRYISFFPGFLRSLAGLEEALGWLPLGGQYVALAEVPVRERLPEGPGRDLSLVLPFYNEEANVIPVARGLLSALQEVDLELVLVDNGSTDRTGERIDRLAAEDPRVRKVVVYPNRGYGLGVRRGLEAARGRAVGYLGGDGQIAPQDVARTWRRFARGDVDMAMVWRVERGDGTFRQVISRVWNGLFSLVAAHPHPDVNGTPKIFRRSALPPLCSRDWFLDAELLLEARLRGWRIAQVPVRFLPRREGSSHVRWQTSLEFLLNLVRFGLRYWIRRLRQPKTAG